MVFSNDSSIIEEWHPTKNGTLTFQDGLTLPSVQKFWWIGKCGHDWDSNIRNRKLGKGCPYCVGKKVLVGFNDLATTHPNLIPEWHPTKNGTLKPQDFSKGSSQKVIWLGNDCGHTWGATIVSRSMGSRCAVCHGKQVEKGVTDLATTHPEIAAQYHPLYNDKKADEVSYGSIKLAFWICDAHEEPYKARITHKTRGDGICYFCSNKELLLGFNDLATTYPALAEEWHPIKNGTLKPQDITSSFSKHKIWWLGACGHDWDALLSNRIRHNTKCPICCGARTLEGYNDLATLYPEIAREWHPTKNKGLSPNNVSGGTNKKVFWICPNNHDYETSINYRTGRKTNCPICANLKILIGFNDLSTTHPELAKEWHPTKNGTLTPQDIVAGTRRKIWWICSYEHYWYASANDRKRGQGCPTCNKGGFSPNLPSTFYFIYHPILEARKIGIANDHAGRIADWTKKGWIVIYTISDNEGTWIQKLETQVLNFLRKDLKLKQELSQKDLGNMGGASETFSPDGISNDALIQKIILLWETNNKN